MARIPIDATLSAEEWDLVAALRGLPPGPLRARVEQLLRDVVAFVREPGCAEMQADGVPCTTATAQCDQCVHLAAMIDGLAKRASSAVQRR